MQSLDCVRDEPFIERSPCCGKTLERAHVGPVGGDTSQPVHTAGPLDSRAHLDDPTEPCPIVDASSRIRLRGRSATELDVDAIEEPNESPVFRDVKHSARGADDVSSPNPPSCRALANGGWPIDGTAHRLGGYERSLA